jgi:hypothetical protein
MWDFNFSQALQLMAKTAPFILLRLCVYFGITLASLFVTGTSAGIGYGLASFGDNPGAGAFIGGLIGFGVISAVLYWLREYILYLVKAAHIAVLVEALEGRELPAGKDQLAHGQEVVKVRFTEASVLFGIDQLIKGVLRILNGTLRTVAFWLPVPGLSQIVGVINGIVNASLTYVDEIILAYNIKIGSTNPWQSSSDALVLYAQNYKHMLKNAVFLLAFMYLFSLLIIVLILGPVGAVIGLFPGVGAAGIWAFVAAVLLAWSLKAALLEPLAVVAMTQVFFKVIEGQVPNPEWEQKLASASGKFRDLVGKARAYAPPSNGTVQLTPKIQPTIDAG